MIILLSPDVLEIIDDPEVGGGVEFLVCRKKIIRIRGSVSESITQINATGNIQPEGKSAAPGPAEDVLDERIVIYTTFTLQPGGKPADGTYEADEILYDQIRYRITSVENYYQWGFTVGHATRMRE